MRPFQLARVINVLAVLACLTFINLPNVHAQQTFSQQPPQAPAATPLAPHLRLPVLRKVAASLPILKRTQFAQRRAAGRGY